MVVYESQSHLSHPSSALFSKVFLQLRWPCGASSYPVGLLKKVGKNQLCWWHHSHLCFCLKTDISFIPQSIYLLQQNITKRPNAFYVTSFFSMPLDEPEWSWTRLFQKTKKLFPNQSSIEAHEEEVERCPQPLSTVHNYHSVPLSPKSARLPPTICPPAIRKP